jgi:predicted RNA-binding Zn ribbon-like protein
MVVDLGGTWMEAPQHAALVRDFVNTARRSPQHDDLSTPAALAEWLHEHGLTERRRVATADDLDLAIRLREGLRRALLAHVDPECAECQLDRITAELPLVVRFAASEPVLDAAGDDARAGLTRVVAAIARAQGDGSWARLKACASDECHAAYFDTSKNRSRAWCDMQVCGNRAKTRTFRQRHGVRLRRARVS